MCTDHKPPDCDPQKVLISCVGNPNDWYWFPQGGKCLLIYIVFGGEKISCSWREQLRFVHTLLVDGSRRWNSPQSKKKNPMSAFALSILRFCSSFFFNHILFIKMVYF
eukprot:TRINITY_DN30967_c0_g1_i1.p1 TRINITY_DN30967_c0_g1~~TRINITY_DN30967_c0_g1_i1.p1  ORF type:complete len:108 (-),score=3.20 TRINITY_DN30967_c0_g1_i1:85-408(-)